MLSVGLYRIFRFFLFLPLFISSEKSVYILFINLGENGTGVCFLCVSSFQGFRVKLTGFCGDKLLSNFPLSALFGVFVLS